MGFVRSQRWVAWVMVLLVAALGSAHASIKAAELIVTVEDAPGKPVKGVGVSLLGGHARPAHAVSDEKGEVRFAGNGHIQVVLDDPRFPRTMAYGELKQGATIRTKLFLIVGTPVTGTVKDSAGTPIAGAAIEILPYGRITPPATTSDAKGQFTAMLGEGEWRIKASKDGKSDTWTKLTINAKQPTAQATITLPDAASLTVETDCKVRGCGGGEVVVSVENSGFTQYLDANGASRFPELPIGDAIVTVRHDANPRHPILGEVRIKLAPGAQKITVATLVLDAGASIQGVLVDDKGVRASNKKGGQLVVDVHFLQFNRRVIARANGSFTVPNLMPGPVELTGLRINPKDPMSGANGLRMTTKLVAPAKGAKVRVNNFVRP